jgi:DNA-directed RNA polymerase subunit M/transcription elongation factor TFIIS
MISKERTIYINLIENKLTLWDEWNTQLAEDKQTQLSNIEAGCYEYVLDIAEEDGYEKSFGDYLFATTYSSIVNKILSNLIVKDDNRQLLNYIMGNKEYDELGDEIVENEEDRIQQLKLLAKMTTEELCPNSNKKIRDELESRKKQIIKRNICKIFTCPKCKHNETTSKIHQTKALDEGSTQTIKCERCNYRWALS